MQRKKIFMSYCSLDEKIADIVEKNLVDQIGDFIEVVRYTRLPYGASFKEFMQRIGKYPFAICIVSDSYLKSRACMYEVGELVRNEKWKKKILFLVLSENDRKYYDKQPHNIDPNLYGNAIKRNRYKEYWLKELKKYESEQRKNIEVAGNHDFITEMNEVRHIAYDDISIFTEFLAITKGIPLEEHLSNGFEWFVKRIIPNWNNGLNECKTLEQILAKAITELCSIAQTDYNQIILQLKDGPYNNQLVVCADNINNQKQCYRIVHQDGAIGKAFYTDRIINIDDVQDDGTYLKAVWETKSELCIPISFAGKTYGVINSEAEIPNYYSDNLVKRLEKLSGAIAVQLYRIQFRNDVQWKEIEYIKY